MPRKRTSTKSRARGREKTKAKPADAADCAACIPAKCCMYFSTEIDTPHDERDFDDILWMVAHRDVEVYTKSRKWYLMVRTPCRFYEPARGCLIYPARPRICRQHQTTSCEYDDDYEFDLHFRSYEELERYYRKRFPAPKAKARTRR